MRFEAIREAARGYPGHRRGTLEAVAGASFSRRPAPGWLGCALLALLLGACTRDVEIRDPAGADWALTLRVDGQLEDVVGPGDFTLSVPHGVDVCLALRRGDGAAGRRVTGAVVDRSFLGVDRDAEITLRAPGSTGHACAN
jgi:hypothetical protein